MTELYFFIECFHSNNDDCGILGRLVFSFAIKNSTTHNFVTTLLAKERKGKQSKARKGAFTRYKKPTE